MNLSAHLIHQVKTQYLHKIIYNVVDTSIKHQDIWSIHSGKRLYLHAFHMVDTAFSYGRALYRLLISPGIIHGKRK